MSQLFMSHLVQYKLVRSGVHTALLMEVGERKLSIYYYDYTVLVEMYGAVLE
jgi:hypothetical protein